VRLHSSHARYCFVFCSLAAASLTNIKNAAAEKILSHDGDWTIFSDGRVGGFLDYVNADGYPRPALDSTGAPKYDLRGGGMLADTNDPNGGRIERLRLRSGFVGNTLGFGVRGPVGERTTIKGYIQIHMWIDNDGEQKGAINYPDARQGYLKIESFWGSVLVGRTRGLFSRGATDIDLQYGHGFGLGYPGAVDSSPPGFTQGHVGFGVLGGGFGTGVIYGTPPAAGLHLDLAIFDPVRLQGAWTRTKWPRLEAEITFERPIGELGKFVLFGNGAYQLLYQAGAPDSTKTSTKGVGYGGRLELGPVRLGVAGHYGQGLGLNYALENSDAAVTLSNELRTFEGYYAQSMFVLGSVDVSVGWGITRVLRTTSDQVINTATGLPSISLIKQQQGISCGAVYHIRPWLHYDVDFFRADFTWYLGEKQVAYIANTGLLFTW
jgi:hypothetical protein